MDLVTPLHFSWILMPVKPPTTNKANSFDSTDHQHKELTIEKEREREREREERGGRPCWKLFFLSES
jgi:hypothetical protein